MFHGRAAALSKVVLAIHPAAAALISYHMVVADLLSMPCLRYSRVLRGSCHLIAMRSTLIPYCANSTELRFPASV